MLDRRSFLRWSFATGLGLPSLPAASAAEKPADEFERALAKADSLDVLGRPRSWSLVRDGLHPISPERVVVMTEKGGDGWSSLNKNRNERLRERLANLGLSGGKLDLGLRLMHVLTDHYKVPYLFPTWATGLARREALASTGMGHGFGLLHQFQDASPVRLVNPPVDWWLFLFPEGVEWGAFDEKPVFGMVAHIFPPDHHELPALKLRTWELTSRVGWIIGKELGWERIARLDRLTAAKSVNRAVLANLPRRG